MRKHVAIGAGIGLFSIAAITAGWLLMHISSDKPVNVKNPLTLPIPKQASSSVPLAASSIPNPDGSPEWPTRSSDLNIERSAVGGPGVLFIHNGTKQRLYAKLCVADGTPCTGARHVMIMPHSDWPILNIASGGYQVRIRTVESPFFGAASDAFELSDRLPNAHVHIQSVQPLDSSKYIIPLASIDPAEF